MKKYIKAGFITVETVLFGAGFIVLFSGMASAYLDPSVMTYAIQAIAGVIIAVGAAVGIYWRKAKKKINNKLGVDENRHKEVESDDILVKTDAATKEN